MSDINIDFVPTLDGSSGDRDFFLRETFLSSLNKHSLGLFLLDGPDIEGFPASPKAENAFLTR